MTAEEVARRDDRVSALYTSGWVVDTVTAVLMSTDVGNSGEAEPVARQKADAILRHLGLDPLARCNTDWTRTDHCAVASGVVSFASTALNPPITTAGS